MIREMTPADRRFVVPTWVHSSSYGLAKRDRFRLVDRILDGGERVVVLGSASGAVHAWACGRAGLLHYAYTAPEVRGHGFARKLITEILGEYPERIWVTHRWRNRPRFLFSHRGADALYALLRKEAA